MVVRGPVQNQAKYCQFLNTLIFSVSAKWTKVRRASRLSQGLQPSAAARQGLQVGYFCSLAYFSSWDCSSWGAWPGGWPGAATSYSGAWPGSATSCSGGWPGAATSCSFSGRYVQGLGGVSPWNYHILGPNTHYCLSITHINILTAAHGPKAGLDTKNYKQITPNTEDTGMETWGKYYLFCFCFSSLVIIGKRGSKRSLVVRPRPISPILQSAHSKKPIISNST